MACYLCTMAYTRKNKLLQMQDVIDCYNLHKLPGVTTAYVYRTHIFPKFRISLSTLYIYLSTPVSRELKKLDEASNQLRLF